MSESGGADRTRYVAAEKMRAEYFPGRGDSRPPGLEAIAMMRKASQWMRAHGTPKCSDPDTGGNSCIVGKPVFDSDDPMAEKAQQERQKYVPTGHGK